MENYLEIGQIVNTFGIKGQIKIMPFTDDIKRFNKLKTIYIKFNDNLKEEEIQNVKYQKNLVLLKLKNYDDINEVEKFKNSYVYIDRKDAVELPEDTYFITDLLKLEVYTEDNCYLGKLIDIFSTKSNDVYVVKKDNGKEILLPAVGEVIKSIDMENRKMLVNLVEGLSEEWKEKGTKIGDFWKGLKQMKFDILTLFPESFNTITLSIIRQGDRKQINKY